MSLLTTIAAFAFALGVLIVVHELGHYFVARWCGVKVLRFSLGFGRPLLCLKLGRDRTEWILAAFPLGGYVKMLDEREDEVAPHEQARAFNRQPVFRRILIVLAGPAANFLLAIALYWVIFVSGIPGLKPVIGGVTPNSPAALAQLATGDVIVKVGPQAVATWQDARWHLLKYAVSRQPVSLEVHNARGEIHWRTLNLSEVRSETLDGDFLRALGFARLQPPLDPVIGRLIEGGAGARAGLLADDLVVAVDGEPVARWDQLVGIISSSPGKRLVFEVRRGQQLQALAVTPDAVLDKSVSIGRIGATPKIDRGAMEKYVVEVRYGAAESLGKALDRTWDTSVFSLQMLGKMLVGDVSLKNLSGPITIADYAGQSAQVGWISYLVFLALISISLGVLNLLPIPLLDGGHLMYYMLEILKGSPLSEKTLAISQQIGMGVLLVLMVFALYNDIARLANG
jgi:regulator of sigma E protease